MDKEMKTRKEILEKEIEQLKAQLEQAQNVVKQAPIMIAYRQGALAELIAKPKEGEIPKVKNPPKK
jgi:tellurite resistance protein